MLLARVIVGAELIEMKENNPRASRQLQLKCKKERKKEKKGI